MIRSMGSIGGLRVASISYFSLTDSIFVCGSVKLRWQIKSISFKRALPSHYTTQGNNTSPLRYSVLPSARVTLYPFLSHRLTCVAFTTSIRRLNECSAGTSDANRNACTSFDVLLQNERRNNPIAKTACVKSFSRCHTRRSWKRTCAEIAVEIYGAIVVG